jgi:hypothetical protein
VLYPAFALISISTFLPCFLLDSSKIKDYLQPMTQVLLTAHALSIFSLFHRLKSFASSGFVLMHLSVA